MNERKTSEPSEQKISSKLVPFPVNASDKAQTQLSKRYWLIAGLSSLLVIAAVSCDVVGFGERRPFST